MGAAACYACGARAGRPAARAGLLPQHEGLSGGCCGKHDDTYGHTPIMHAPGPRRRYMYLSGRVNLKALEVTIQNLIGSGMDPKTENNPYLGFVYTSFQERATKVRAARACLCGLVRARGPRQRGARGSAALGRARAAWPARPIASMPSCAEVIGRAGQGARARQAAAQGGARSAGSPQAQPALCVPRMCTLCAARAHAHAARPRARTSVDIDGGCVVVSDAEWRHCGH